MDASCSNSYETVFNMAGMVSITVVQRDMLMLENQIPFLVIKKLVEVETGDLIMCILKRIKEVIPTYLFMCDYPTDLNSRMNEVIKLLDREVRMSGICGIGGIGKTTLAKAVYNRLLQQHNVCENCSFLANVREASKQYNGIVGLQKQLLYDVLRLEMPINNRDEGSARVKRPPPHCKHNIFCWSSIFLHFSATSCIDNSNVLELLLQQIQGLEFIPDEEGDPMNRIVEIPGDMRSSAAHPAIVDAALCAMGLK
ncbi:hypothetical protein EJ110_NYTH18255 [Nymphaea thermarum]|nr:hypothetical protein EJ110_NYTH18255 [Nymphaea thermarum]